MQQTKRDRPLVAASAALTSPVLDALSAHITVLDHWGFVIAVNAAWDQFSVSNDGDPARSGVGRNYLDVCRAAGDDQVARDTLEGITRVLDGALPSFQLDYACHAPDQRHWFQLRATPLPGVGGAVVTHTDVTPQYLAEESIRRQERRFESIVHNAGDLLSVIDEDGTISYHSPAIKRILGYAPEECSSIDTLTFLHPGDLDDARRAFSEISDVRGGYVRFEIRAQHKDGSWRRLEAVATNLLDDPDVRGVVVNTRDVTEHAELRASLKETSRTLHFALEAAQMGVWDWDATTGLVAWIGAENLSPETLAPGAFTAAWQQSLGHVHQDDLSKLVGSESEDRVRSTGEFEAEHRVNTLDGGIRWFYNRGISVERDEIGLSRRMVGVTMDVTDVKAAEAATKVSEARFKALVQDSEDMIVVFDADGGAQYMSPAVERTLGYPMAIFSERLRVDLVHPDDEETVTRVWTAIAAAKSGERERLEYRVRTSSGDWVWLTAVVTNHLDDPGICGIVFNARDITLAKRFEDELRRLALHDPLTGLPNRTLFQDRLNQELNKHRPDDPDIAVLFLDVDRFKLINDEQGHAGGDAVLIAIAARLSPVLGRHDTLARFGGDEFVALLTGARDGGGARGVATRMLKALEEPLLAGGREIWIQASIGVADGNVEPKDATTFLRAADLALYGAKAAGRGQVVMYEPSLGQDHRRRLALGHDLRGADTRGEFELHYQPIVDLASGVVVEVEALLRWRHPLNGLTSPLDFVPLAEETGQIVEIGRWVLAEACHQAVAWGADGPSIAINLSARQFQDPDLFEDVKATLSATGVDPRRLRIEITEHLLISDLGGAIATLTLLRQLGVTIAIDDFGTGYSSLGYLRDLPIDAIKLDRSFITEIGPNGGALPIIEGITTLSHILGLAVTAEGIETSHQLARLREIGCDRGQGFLLGRPAPSGPIPPRPIVPMSPLPSVVTNRRHGERRGRLAP